MHKLLLKQHNTSGLKYLCYTKKKDHETYKGSGKYWREHVNTHGYDVTTTLLYETESYEEFVKYATEYSLQQNIVEDESWANLRIEDGAGGDTVSDKMWITNGSEERYILKDNPIPIGWKLGRCNSAFNDASKQKELASRVDTKARAKKLKDAWDSGKFIRDHSKCGVSGDNNPAKRPEVREKIRTSALNRETITCPKCGKTGKKSPGMYKWHFDNCNYDNDNN